MLTESEREWVRENKTRNGCIYARRCRYTCFEPPYCPVIPTKNDLMEAAEFESRVAAKLTNIHFGTEDCAYCGNHINMNEYCGECKTASSDKRCLACRLKYARLKVEEEMDGNGQ